MEQMRYDAFISYRHGELDGLVAEKLHKMLETYRIPGAIAKKVGKKKLTRVFRDREELPTSSNLSDSINEALETSSFLLLICSRRTCGSQWVMREVERFGELRGKDRIITLLIDGEPDESFPPGLREREVDGETIFVEPLAGDVRAETWKGSLKLLKEEKIRLLAPILGCAFDDLRRRHRRRRIQRISTVVGAAFAFVLAFGSFSTYQFIQINRQMQMKLQNQSYVLSEYSANQLAEGDRDMATLLALSALPENLDRPNRPLVREAQRALTDSLGVYDVVSGFHPHKVAEFDADLGKVFLSPEETYAAAVYPYHLDILDAETGKVVVSLPTLRSTLSDGVFLSEEVILYAGEKGLTAYDIGNRSELWRGQPATSIAFAKESGIIAAVYKDDTQAVLYNQEGTMIATVDFVGKSMKIPADDSFVYTHDRLFALNEDGSLLAVSFADGSLSVFDPLGAGFGIGVPSERQIYPAGGAIHFEGGFFGSTLAFSFIERDPYNSAFLLYDVYSGQEIERYTSDTNNFLVGIMEDGIYVAFEDTLMAVNPVTGAVSTAFITNDVITAFDKKDKTFLISQEDGSYLFGGETLKQFRSSYICQLLALGNDFALVGSYDAKIIRILKGTDGSGEELMYYGENQNFSEAKIDPLTGRAIFYSFYGVNVFDLSGNLLFEAEFPNPDLVADTQFDQNSGNVVVLYEDRFLLYSSTGNEGSILRDVSGKAGGRSVFYTRYGVSVLGEDGKVTLYDIASGVALEEFDAGVQTDYGVVIGGSLLKVEAGAISFHGQEIGSGEIIGADRIAEDSDTYAFAISDGTRGSIFTVKNDQVDLAFTFPLRGVGEVYFSGGFVFISPLNGSGVAYDLEGNQIRDFQEQGFLAEAFSVGNYIALDYISTSGERYSFLLEPSTLETVAYLPGFLGEMEDGRLVLDDGHGGLRGVKLGSLSEYVEMAKARLEGRTMTVEEQRRFRAE